MAYDPILASPSESGAMPIYLFDAQLLTLLGILNPAAPYPKLWLMQEV
jgi:hypothetical protein